MAAALIAGPAVAILGVVAIFFVLRRKSVEKRSMYSARRSQIEHKVRAARQRTLAPHGHGEKPAEAPPASPFAPAESAPMVMYETATYQAPPSAPPPPPMIPPPPPMGSDAPPAASPWEVGPTAPSPFSVPAGEPEPFMPIPGPKPPAPPAPEPPAFEPATSEPVWTPAPAPLEPVGQAEYETSAPVEPAQPASTPAGGASWSVVGDSKDMSITAEPEPKQKGKQKAGATASWQLASGEAPGDEAEEIVKRPSSTVAIAQYAVFVVGLVMVLIGVLIMIGSSHSG